MILVAMTTHGPRTIAARDWLGSLAYPSWDATSYPGFVGNGAVYFASLACSVHGRNRICRNEKRGTNYTELKATCQPAGFACITLIGTERDR
eukprot:3935912-Amphidinium_carterae.1